MSKYAKGKDAVGLCDYCGFRWPLKQLKYEYDGGIKNGFRACPDCWSEDHPQNFLDRVDTYDPITLRDPRPDLGLASSRSLFGFGSEADPAYASKIRIYLGKVTVTTT